MNSRKEKKEKKNEARLPLAAAEHAERGVLPMVKNGSCTWTSEEVNNMKGRWRGLAPTKALIEAKIVRLTQILTKNGSGPDHKEA